jgi:Domain of unknown function (DUF4286)
MVLYNVTINVDDNIREEWLKWMKEVHIPEVLQTGLFLHHRIFQLLTVVGDNEGTNYAVQYYCEDMQHYQEYEREHAARLQNEVNVRYAGKFVAFRTILQEV